MKVPRGCSCRRGRMPFFSFWLFFCLIRSSIFPTTSPPCGPRFCRENRVSTMCDLTAFLPKSAMNIYYLLFFLSTHQYLKTKYSLRRVLGLTAHHNGFALAHVSPPFLLTHQNVFSTTSSRGEARPWCVKRLFLFFLTFEGIIAIPTALHGQKETSKKYSTRGTTSPKWRAAASRLFLRHSPTLGPSSSTPPRRCFREPPEARERGAWR